MEATTSGALRTLLVGAVVVLFVAGGCWSDSPKSAGMWRLALALFGAGIYLARAKSLVNKGSKSDDVDPRIWLVMTGLLFSVLLLSAIIGVARAFAR